MKRINGLLNFLAATGISAMLISCATQTFDAQTKGYQTKTNKSLAAYTKNVSRGFTSKAGRGFMDYQSNYGNPYGGQLLQSAIGQEVQDCVELISNIPQTCDNYNFMVSSLSRCLDRVITYRNPVMTYAFRNLDSNGQRYWAYLLNWRRPSTYDFFLNTSDYGPMAGYAQNGYYSNSGD